MAKPWTDDPSGRPSAAQRERARSLRHHATEPEKRLWWHLRHRLPVEGSHFRRQVPIGRYVADFCCLGARLVIEVDGEQHGFDGHRSRDEARTRDLEALGYRVLRFSNREVMTSMDVVLDTIFAALQTPALPSPLRGGVAVGVAGSERDALASAAAGPTASRPSRFHQAAPPPPLAPPRKGEGKACEPAP